MKVTIARTSYVGLVSGACLAEVGNKVLSLDLDRASASSKRKEASRPKQATSWVTTGNIQEVVKYYETRFELLAKQFELDNIDEASDSALIQVLDKAVPAERKSKTRRALITLTGAFARDMLGIKLAFMQPYNRSRQNPYSNSCWQQLALV
ncbi:MAG: hypothetical protein ACOH2B_05850 [Burkholderiaceae bacterium]